MKVGDLLIDEREIVETFVRASGPGGQNVNKVASAVASSAVRLFVVRTSSEATSAWLSACPSIPNMG